MRLWPLRAHHFGQVLWNQMQQKNPGVRSFSMGWVEGLWPLRAHYFGKFYAALSHLSQHLANFMRSGYALRPLVSFCSSRSRGNEHWSPLWPTFHFSKCELRKVHFHFLSRKPPLHLSSKRSVRLLKLVTLDRLVNNDTHDTMSIYWVYGKCGNYSWSF